ncbi:MAG TPA: DNA-binding protein [archaeon]|nr:DNA-binding protein [archaeon]
MAHTKALLDTNFLLIPAKFKVDIFLELRRLGVTQFYTLDSVLKEMETLTKRPGEDSKHAKLSLKLLESKGVKILESKGQKVDKELLSLSKSYVICTQDKELINQLKSERAEIVYLRQKKYLIRE